MNIDLLARLKQVKNKTAEQSEASQNTFTKLYNDIELSNMSLKDKIKALAEIETMATQLRTNYAKSLENISLIKKEIVNSMPDNNKNEPIDGYYRSTTTKNKIISRAEALDIAKVGGFDDFFVRVIPTIKGLKKAVKIGKLSQADFDKLVKTNKIPTLRKKNDSK